MKKFIWALTLCLLALASSQTAHAQAGSTDAASTGTAPTESAADKTHIGGYGEVSYKHSEKISPNRFNIDRFVIYLDHYFSEQWAIKSETEIENVKIEGGAGGEIGLEQAFLDYHGSTHFGWRVGLLLIPTGIINQTHEPNTFFSVERPKFDHDVIPTTWREIGTGIYGDITEGVKYQLLLTEGLLGGNFSINGIYEGKQEGSAGATTDGLIAGSDASHPAVSGKLEYLPVTGLRIGGSFYYQSKTGTYDRAGNDSVSIPAISFKAPLTAFFLDARYDIGALKLRGIYGIEHVGDALSLVQFYRKQIAEQISGGYFEAAYNVMSFIAPSSDAEVLPFARFESMRFTPPIGWQSYLPANEPNATGTNPKYLTFGIAVKPLSELIFKADYTEIFDLPSSVTGNRFALGAGFAF
ncbi:MAG: hypothetical protein ABI444_02270 [Candidatus Kapaibacterium sp.]